MDQLYEIFHMAFLSLTQRIVWMQSPDLQSVKNQEYY